MRLPDQKWAAINAARKEGKTKRIPRTPGALFEYQGKRYQKTAMDSIRDENGQPSSFRPEWEGHADQ